MRINSIQLKYFKGFEDSGKVPIGSVTSIIGRNGHGKTTLIDAIKNTFIYEKIDPNSEQRNGTDKNPTVCLECDITSKDSISGITSDTTLKIERTVNGIKGANNDIIRQIFNKTNIVTQPEIIQIPFTINLSNSQNNAAINVLVKDNPGWKNIFGSLTITPDYIKNQLRDLNTREQFQADTINDVERDFIEYFNKWTMNITNRTYDFKIFFEANNEASLGVYMHVRHKLAKSQEWSKWSKLEQKSTSFRFLLTLVCHRFHIDGHSENYILLFDEPFVNMHPKMQVEVKNILKEFSKYNQIIYTTHSPYLKQENNSLFCIEKSPDAFVIKTEDKLDPEEQAQYIDDFSMIAPSDLQRSFDIQHQITKSNKDLICLVEGKTDVEYINHVLKVHDKECILNYIDIYDLQGQGNLSKTFDVQKNLRKKTIQITPNMLFIYDCDADMKKKSDEKIGLFVEQIPFNENGKVRDGIENLLSDESIEKAYEDGIITQFITEKVSDDSGKTKEEKRYLVKDNEKCKLQVWVCKQPKEVEDFEAFKDIITIIESTLHKLSKGDS